MADIKLCPDKQWIRARGLGPSTGIGLAKLAGACALNRTEWIGRKGGKFRGVLVQDILIFGPCIVFFHNSVGIVGTAGEANVAAMKTKRKSR